MANASARLPLRAVLGGTLRSPLPWATGRGVAEGAVAAATASLRAAPCGVSCTPPFWASGRTPLPLGHLGSEERSGGGCTSGGRGHSRAAHRSPGAGRCGGSGRGRAPPLPGALGGASRPSPPWALPCAGGSRARGGEGVLFRRPRRRGAFPAGGPRPFALGRSGAVPSLSAAAGRHAPTRWPPRGAVPSPGRAKGATPRQRPVPAPLTTSRGPQGRSRGSREPRTPDPWRSGGPRPSLGRSAAASRRPGEPWGPSHGRGMLWRRSRQRPRRPPGGPGGAGRVRDDQVGHGRSPAATGRRSAARARRRGRAKAAAGLEAAGTTGGGGKGARGGGRVRGAPDGAGRIRGGPADPGRPVAAPRRRSGALAHHWGHATAAGAPANADVIGGGGNAPAGAQCTPRHRARRLRRPTAEGAVGRRGSCPRPRCRQPS